MGYTLLCLVSFTQYYMWYCLISLHTTVDCSHCYILFCGYIRIPWSISCWCHCEHSKVCFLVHVRSHFYWVHTAVKLLDDDEITFQKGRKEALPAEEGSMHRHIGARDAHIFPKCGECSVTQGIEHTVSLKPEPWDAPSPGTACLSLLTSTRLIHLYPSFEATVSWEASQLPLLGELSPLNSYILPWFSWTQHAPHWPGIVDLAFLHARLWVPWRTEQGWLLESSVHLGSTLPFFCPALCPEQLTSMAASLPFACGSGQWRSPLRRQEVERRVRAGDLSPSSCSAGFSWAACFPSRRFSFSPKQQLYPFGPSGTNSPEISRLGVLHCPCGCPTSEAVLLTLS